VALCFERPLGTGNPTPLVSRSQQTVERTVQKSAYDPCQIIFITKISISLERYDGVIDIATEVWIRRPKRSQTNARREHAKADLSPDKVNALDQLYPTTTAYHKCRGVEYDTTASDSNLSHWTTYTYDNMDVSGLFGYLAFE
jgi:hypothetical protein